MTLQRELHIISGNVQGVGFRPFIYTTALACALTGFVQNTHEGVRIEIQGQAEQLKAFNQKLQDSLPPLALIASHQREALPSLQDEKIFSILHSRGQKGHNVFIGPDVAICQECLEDIFSPTNRRYLYPFTNCTNCGPRYSIIRSIPYDRASTSMACFPLCEQCAEEYNNPTNRRFHAQPNACPKCGPHVWYVSAQNVQDGHTTISEEGYPLMPSPPSPSAISNAVRLVIEGKILALKGLGGFHLVCLAHNQEAVATLRQRKGRPHKPFALMVASLQDARTIVTVSPQAEALLTSPAHPIVLCPKIVSGSLGNQGESLVVKANAFAGKTTSPCSASLSEGDSSDPLLPNITELGTIAPDTIAPDTDFLGIMLPYTPLHHIFMAELQDQLNKQRLPHPPVVVMTSGNLGGEPICLENREALAKLSDLADGFLLHNRDILIRVDDSVVAPQADNSTTIFRRARGYAPLPIPLPPCTPSIPSTPSPAPSGSTGSTGSSGSAQCVHTATTTHSPLSPHALPSVLGLGAELKNTICLNKGSNAFMSQHLGDMQHIEATGFHDEIVEHFQNTLAVSPSLVVHDKHPNYYTTRKAKELGYPSLALQHHAAHAFALLGENPVNEPCLVLALDGTGYGDDGTLWGGEALWVHGQTGQYERLGAFSPLPLPGGEAAIAEPWRIAHALCLQNAIDPRPFPWLPSHAETARHLPMMLEKGINTPVSTSCGRLFDAVSALLGQVVSVSYEGQAAIRLENLALQSAGLTSMPHPDMTPSGMAPSALAPSHPAYPDQTEASRTGPCQTEARLTDPGSPRFGLTGYGTAQPNHQKRGQVALLPCPLHMHNGFCTLDTNKLFVGVCEEIAADIPHADVALSFHQSLVTGLAVWAKTLCAWRGLHSVGLTGGCFNNSLLLTGLKDALARFGLHPLTHHKLPHGDGNIAYGQVVWGAIMSHQGGKK